MESRKFEIRINDEFMEKLEYLRKIYGFRTLAETIRWIVGVAYRKEQ